MNFARRIGVCALAITACAGGLCAQGNSARLEFDRAQTEVGQPVKATLSVEHDASSRPRVDSLGLDDSWVVFAAKAGPTLAMSAQAGRATTTFEFEIASLEPGDRAIPQIPVPGSDQKLAVEGPTLKVAGVLAESEDAPRAMKGLREIESQDERANLALILGLSLGVLALLSAVLFAWRRKRARSAVESGPAPSARLAVLETRPLDTPGDVQAAHFALTRLLRESADLAAGRDRSGMTDEEWQRAARRQFEAAGMSAAEFSALEALLERAAQVKYGSERPTHWATREALASARGFAARLETLQDAKDRPREVAA